MSKNVQLSSAAKGLRLSMPDHLITWLECWRMTTRESLLATAAIATHQLRISKIASVTDRITRCWCLAIGCHGSRAAALRDGGASDTRIVDGRGDPARSRAGGERVSLASHSTSSSKGVAQVTRHAF